MLFESLRGGICIHAIILAAGRGSRMGALSASIPKGLIPIAGKTIIHRLLETLSQSGVQSFHIGVGWKSELFKQHLLELTDSYSIDIVQVSSLEKGPLHTLFTVLEDWTDNPFLICPADYFVSSSAVKQLIKSHRSAGESRVVTVSVAAESKHEFPVYIQSDGRISGLGSPLTHYDSVYNSAMLIAANPGTIGHFRSAHASSEKTVVAVVNQMISKGMNVYAVKVTGKWFDIDSIPDLLAANDMILSEQVSPNKGCIVVPAGATIDVSEKIEMQSGTLLASGVSIIGPTFIAPACRIEQNCRVGPGVSMGQNTELSRETIIERSILFGSACVDEGVCIKDAIVYGNHIIKECE
ncbi:MAG: NTP transferase domain-containing protein [Candidatus Thorarchaeota archaeon]